MKYLFLFACIVFSFATKAQDLGETEGKSYFKDGINLDFKALNFKSRFRFRMQNRFTYQTEDAKTTSPELVDFSVRRLRLRLDGTVWDPRLLYRIQLSFTRGDMDFDRTQYPNILRDAVVGWKLTEKSTIWYGQTKLPGNRQRIVSSGSQEFVDRSILNATFNIDRDLGVQLHHWMGESSPFSVKLAVSNGEGRATDNKNDGLSYTGRLEWLPLGEFKDEGDFFEADLSREASPRLALGSAYNLNKKTTRPGGQLGKQFTTQGLNIDLETYFADLLYKHRGFSFYGEYAHRWTPDPVFIDGTETVTVFQGHGYNFQSGYVFDNNVQPAVRFTHLIPERDAQAGSANEQKQYTAALSKYYNQHKVKLQGDLSYDEQLNHVKETYASSWIFRLQLELGI